MALSPSQCRAARGLLGWSQDDLADASKVSRATIANFEREATSPYASSLDQLQKTLERAGAIFIEENGEGPGVRLRKRKPASKRR
ncbi:helix-turn-helix domain-containing protein [Hypericibacter sp.]|uniref:helix-turn-helix domain-containing protein n=1 Tax=Hypericibacter sp. TaxID=2705401 RepID=UPI003D6D361A